MVIAGVVLAFWPGLLEPFAPVKAAVLRAVGLALLAWTAAEALGCRLPRPSALALAALAWAVVHALATLTSLEPRLSFWGEPRQREGLATALALVGLHLGALRAHRDARDVQDTLRVVLVVALAAAAYAQLQLAGLDPVRWSGLQTYTSEGASALRPGGPLGNPILLGVVLAAAIPLALARLAEPASDATQLVPAAALVAASLLVTLSRGAWLAAAAGAAAALALALAARADARRLAWTAVASLAPAIVFAAWRAGAPLVARLGEGLAAGSTVARAEYARGALALWSDRRWLGVGPDAYGLAFPAVQTPALWRHEWSGVPLHAHSVPLQVLATLGLLGLAAGAAWVVAAGRAWRSAWREAPGERALLAGIGGALVALLVAGATNAVGLAGAALFAVLTALPACVRAGDAATAEPSRTALPERPARLALGAAALPALVALLTLVPSACELFALAHARAMRDEPQRAALAPAEVRALAVARARSLDRATAAWPHDELLWRLAARASLTAAEVVGGGAAGDGDPAAGDLEAAGVWERAAERAARAAVWMSPRRAASHLALADVLDAVARRTGSEAVADSADAQYVRACLLAPADGWMLVALTRHVLAKGQPDRALGIARTIEQFYPEAAIGHALAGSSWLLLGRPDDARAALERSLAARWEEDAGPQREAAERLLRSISLEGPSPPAPARSPERGPHPRR